MNKKKVLLVTLCLTLASVCGNVFAQSQYGVISAPTTVLTCSQTQITLTANVSADKYEWIKYPDFIGINEEGDVDVTGTPPDDFDIEKFNVYDF